MAKMDNQTLKGVLAAERLAALGADSSVSSDLSQQRTMAFEFYEGDMTSYMPVPEGRSSAVSTDVADTVDGIMPSLMDIFTASDEVVKFDAVGPEDEEAAQQETDYVNYVFHQENPGFITLHSMMKDALIQKNGIVKFWWEEGEDEERETYYDLPDDAFALLAADDAVEIIEHTAKSADIPGPEDIQTVTTHDAVVIRRKPYGRVKVMAVPPEEFLISKQARSIQEARYCAHKTKRTISDLIEQGYARDVVESLPTGTDSPNTEQTARATVQDDESDDLSDVNKQMRYVEVWEEYVRVDYDGDGIAELRKITSAGTGYTILDNEPYDRMPFAGITPILMSHRFWGRSVADLVLDIQKIKTALIRAVLDNAYFANNQRIEIAESHSGDNTLDDLLTNRPGGIIRTKMPGGLIPVPTNPIGQHLFPVLEYMDTVREIRTGVNRMAVGPDANTLNPYNSTATGANILATAAQQRIRLIARTFAETGIKDLFMGIHELILKHGTDARQVKLRNKWVTVDPREWKTRKDMTIMVGLGTGTRDQVQAYLMQILQMQIQALQMQGGAAGPIVTLTNVYNTLKKLTENAGFRSADPFFTEPSQQDLQQAAQPKTDPRMEEVKGKLALKQAEIQGNQQMGAAKLQSDAQYKALQAQLDAMIEKQKADQDLMLEKYKADLKAFGDAQKAKLEAHVALMKPDPVREGGKVG